MAVLSTFVFLSCTQTIETVRIQRDTVLVSQPPLVRIDTMLTPVLVPVGCDSVVRSLSFDVTKRDSTGVTRVTYDAPRRRVGVENERTPIIQRFPVFYGTQTTITKSATLSEKAGWVGIGALLTLGLGVLALAFIRR